MIRGYYTTKASLIEESNDHQQTQWLHLLQPTEKEIQEMSEDYQIPRSFLTNVLDPDEIARSENWASDEPYPKLISLLFPVKTLDDNGFTTYLTQPFAIVLTKNMIITACNSQPIFFEELFDNEYIDTLEDQESFVLEVAWLISYVYISCLKEISKSITALEKEKNISKQKLQLYQLLALKKSLVFIDSATKSNHPVFEEIKKIDHYADTKKARKLLHNMSIEHQQAEMMLRQYYQLVEQVGDLFSAIMSHRLNNLMKVLTSLSIILTVPAIVGAFWGMNVSLPFEKMPFAFWLLLGLSLLISLGVAAILKKKDYM